MNYPRLIPGVCACLVSAALVAGCGGSKAPAPTATLVPPTPAPTVAATATTEPTAAPTAAPTVSAQETTTFTSPLTFSSPLLNNEPIPTPTFELFETSGVVYGRVAAMPPGWVRATVWLAPFTPVSEDGQTGFYVLEPSVHPYTDMFPNGYFQLTSVPPGKYVIISGPTPEEAHGRQGERQHRE